MDPLALLSAQLVTLSLRKLAKKIGVSAAYLSDVMLAKKPPGPKILDYLGLERIDGPVTYRERKADKPNRTSAN